MQRVYHELKRQATDTVVPTASGISGGETATSVDVGTSLLLGVSGSSTPSVSNLVISQTGVSSTSSSTPDTTSSSSSTHSSPSVSTGSVVAIMIAVFLVLIGAMFVIYKYIKKRIASRVRHPLSRGPLVVRGTEGFRDYGKDKQRNNDDERGEGKSNTSTGVRSKSLDSAKFRLFEKDPSIRSVTDEKANVSDDNFDPSTMATFAKYQVDPADNLPLPRPLIAHEASPTVSWDGGTVIGDPFRSLHASVSDNMSPTTVVARQTPQATDSAQHRWESAEVVMMDEATTDTPDTSQNPFDDDSTPRESNDGGGSDPRGGSNPFFNAAQHNPFADRSTRSRNSSVSTAKRSRSYSVSSGPTVPPVENENALLSLLAALHPTPVASDEQTIRSSVYTTATSLADPEPPQAF